VGLRAGLDAVAKRKHPCTFRGSNSGQQTRSLVIILSELPRVSNIIYNIHGKISVIIFIYVNFNFGPKVHILIS